MSCMENIHKAFVDVRLYSVEDVYLEAADDFRHDAILIDPEV